jgi:hypothetical protein
MEGIMEQFGFNTGGVSCPPSLLHFCNGQASHCKHVPTITRKFILFYFILYFYIKKKLGLAWAFAS